MEKGSLNGGPTDRHAVFCVCVCVITLCVTMLIRTHTHTHRGTLEYTGSLSRGLLAQILTLVMGNWPNPTLASSALHTRTVFRIPDQK